jgi:hypothetical protein
MMLAQLPPTASTKIVDYPGVVACIGIATVTAGLLWVINRYDATGGTLTISLIVVLAFVAVVAFSLLYNIPSDDEVTPGVVGGLVAAFGAVVAFWLGRSREGPK